MKSTCEKIREQIPELITGTLPVEQAAEIREHLNQCPDCTAYHQALEADDQLLVDFAESAQPRLHRITENVISALAQQEETLQEHAARTIKVTSGWRLSKLAAAVIIAAVVIILAHFSDFFGVSAPAYDMRHLPRLVKEARSVHLHYTFHFDPSEYGKHLPPVPMDLWIDLSGYRLRQTCSTERWENGKFISNSTGELISNGGYLMGVEHAHKAVHFSRMSDYHTMYKAYRELSSTFRFYAGIDFFRDFQYLGREKIDDVEYDVWENEVQTGKGKNKTRWRDKYWVSPITHEPVRFESWRLKSERKGLWPLASGGKWVLCSRHDKIEWNIPIPDEVFAFEVPDGYEYWSTMETAKLRELDELGRADYKRAVLDPRVNFTLADGSVIMAWSSENQPATESQEALFKSLKVGGDVPPLPLEAYALKPFYPASDVTYHGRHLAYTKKNGHFIEWSIYVPDGPLPKYHGETWCEIIFRFNYPPPDWRTSPVSCGNGIVIESAEDFDRWVLGAMSELSDSGIPPQDLTYEGVLALSKKISYELAKR
jgi:hypothetical protein